MVLSHFYPRDTGSFESQLAADLAVAQWPGAKHQDLAAGEAIGRSVGAEVIALAQSDGFGLHSPGVPPVGEGYWVSSGTPIVASLYGARPFLILRALDAVDEYRRRRDGITIDLPRARRARTHRIDVRTRREPAGLEHGCRRRSHGADDICILHRGARGRNCVHLYTSHPAHHIRQCSGTLERAAPDAHAAERPYGEQRLDLRARLHAGTQDGELTGIGARECFRRDRSHGRGADRRQPGGIDQCHRHALPHHQHPGQQLPDAASLRRLVPAPGRGHCRHRPQMQGIQAEGAHGVAGSSP
ncbi:MAG TPA: hypothetical protein VK939_08825 [Longimicrobiales bacterium]|nr:hypothetical protein [Longimicrobiales bacterium]